MDYKSFEYIRKTLPNEFNWSILYQLFSEDEIELSEAAENYLRTTPWNTNLTIFEEILEAEADGPIVFTIEAQSTQGVVEGNTVLPEGIEKLSAGDNIHVEVKSTKGSSFDFDTIIEERQNYLSIDISGTSLYGFTDYGSLNFYLQSTESREAGIYMDATTYNQNKVEEWGTTATFTITKI